MLNKIIKIVTLGTFIIFVMSVASIFGQTADESELLERIATFAENADKRFSNSHNRFEILKLKNNVEIKEVYLFSLSGNNIEKLHIEFIKGDDYKESETYYFRNGKLCFATEVESTFEVSEKDWLDRWTASYSLKDNKVIHLVTNGHGKSETDDWEPDPFKTSKKRFRHLKKYLNKIDL